MINVVLFRLVNIWPSNATISCVSHVLRSSGLTLKRSGSTLSAFHILMHSEVLSAFVLSTQLNYDHKKEITIKYRIVWSFTWQTAQNHEIHITNIVCTYKTITH